MGAYREYIAQIQENRFFSAEQSKCVHMYGSLPYPAVLAKEEMLVGLPWSKWLEGHPLSSDTLKGQRGLPPFFIQRRRNVRHLRWKGSERAGGKLNSSLPIASLGAAGASSTGF